MVMVASRDLRVASFVFGFGKKSFELRPGKSGFSGEMKNIC
jgi:hypothetical protein